MFRWTLRSLIAEPLALAAGIAAAGSALLLVMFYEAVWAGGGEQIIAYPRNAGADVWVMQRGVENMHMATSYISDWKVTAVSQVSGVEAVEPILYLNTVVEAGNQQWFAYVIGLDSPANRAGPWAMAAGKREPGPGEAVVPAVFAAMTDLGLGSVLRVVDQDFTIVGLSEGTFSMANSIIFIPRVDVEELISSFDIVSFILVTAASGYTPNELAAAIEREVENVSALPADVFLENDRQLAVQMGVETVALMTFICGALAVLIVSFTVYSQTIRQRRELAVAKAVGVSNRALYASVALQAGILALASVFFASFLAWVIMPIVTELIPMVTLKLTSASIIRIGVAGILVALVAAIIPARRIARVDPIAAFHG